MRLAKVIVIQHRHPDLYNVLRLEPCLLKELEAYFRIKALTNLPDYLLALHDRLAKVPIGDLLILANRFDQEKVVPIEKALEAAVEVAIDLERKNSLHELFIWIKKVLTNQEWDDLENRINIGRKTGTPVPDLAQQLLPFRSCEPLRNLLLYGEPDEEICFAGLENHEIDAYFSLAQEAQVVYNLSNSQETVASSQVTESATPNTR